MIRHHPPLELLLDYAAGVADEGAALVVAGHASLCPSCGMLIRDLEAVGAEVLDNIEPEAVSDSLLPRLMEHLEDEPVAGAQPRLGDAETQGLIPLPLRHYIGSNVDELTWRSVGRLFQEFRLPVRNKNIKALLMKVRRGAVLPRHTHRGHEMTLVLAGGYRDGDEQYARGDFSLKDASDTHRPVIDGNADCLCLVVLDAPLKLTGVVGRLISPFLKM